MMTTSNNQPLPIPPKQPSQGRLLAPWLVLLFALCAPGIFFPAGAQSIAFEPLWEIPTGERSYVTTGHTERGIAVNPVTGNVLLASRTASPFGESFQVVILDGETGEELGHLIMTGVGGGIFPLSEIAIAEDGVIYGANLVTSASESAPFKIYRWEDEDSFPTEAYAGSPSDGMRFGDSLAVRGSGANTQLAAGTGGTETGVRFAVFTTEDGENFSAHGFSPAGVTAAHLQLGITFGEGDTILGKRTGAQAHHISFDTADGAAALLESLPILNSISPISFEPELNLLAGVDISEHQLLIYTLSETGAPVLLATRPFPSPATANANGVGGVAFGDDKLVALDTNNGILAFRVALSDEPAPPEILSQPAGQSVLAGAPVTFSVGAVGSPPLSYQWHVNDEPIDGATEANLVLEAVSPADAGSYTVVVTNPAGSLTSDPAELSVTPLAKSGHLEPLWSLSPGARPYLAQDNAQRGLGYNPVSGNVLVVSRTQSASGRIHVLDGETGEDLHVLRTTDEQDQSLLTGGFFHLNMIAVADDGAVYACNLSTSGTDFKIYRWANDDPDTIPTVAYGPDNPGVGRIGDTLDARGAGLDTQIIAASRSGAAVVIFTAFDEELFWPTVIETADAADANFGLSVSFGAGDTFWGTAGARSLRHVEFDLTTWVGTTLHNYPGDEFPSSVTIVGADPAGAFLGAIALETPDNLQLYSLEDLSAGPPVLLHQEPFPTDHPNANGTGTVVIGEDRVYALNTNNGIVAFKLHREVEPGGDPVLGSPAWQQETFQFTLTGAAGREYAVQATADFSGWTEAARVTAGPDGTVQVTVPVSAAAQFYRAVAP